MSSTLPRPARLVPPEFAPGSVWLVGAGPGDPGLLTLHALHALQQADMVLHDALVAPEILALANPDAVLESVGKRAGRPSARQLRINARLVALARRGLRVLRLKGGDPLVFGRGGEEALELAAASVPFRIVPGISAGIGGTATAGVPATHRTLGHAVAFVTAQGAAGLPAAIDWRALSCGAPVLVLYMALRRIADVARALTEAGRPADEPVAFITDATTARQRVQVATLATAAATAAGIGPEAPTLIVVGPVVALRPLLAGWLQTDPMTVLPAADAASPFPAADAASSFPAAHAASHVTGAATA